MRWRVLQGREIPPGRWREERRDLHAEVSAVVGDGLRELPRVTLVLR
jgi:hypothetical protein